MRRIVLPLVAVALMGAASLQSRGWVNDFANVIPDDREVVLERKLDQFEKQTTVEITVVTTPSLNDEDIESWTNRLFRQWEVGKAETNNGLMVVVAPLEHKYRIEVGLGLEPFVTDAEAGRLGRDTLPDAFRQHDYAGGLDRLTDRLIQKIGQLSPAERAQYIVAKNNQAARQAQHAAERKSMFWERVGNGVGGILLLGGSIFGFFAIRRRWRSWQDRRRIRKELSNRLVNLGKFYKEKNPQSVLHMGMTLDAVPKWIQGDMLDHQAGLQSAIHRLYDRIVEASKLKDRSDEDLQLRDEAIDKAEEAQAEYQEHEDALGGIPERIIEIRAQAVDKVAKVSEEVYALKLYAKSLTEKGFGFARLYSKASEQDFDAKLRTLQNLLTNRTEGQDDESEQIIGLAETLRAIIEETGDGLGKVESRLSSIEALYDNLKGRIETCENSFPATQSVAARLQEALPEEQAHEVRLHWQDGREASNLRTMLRAIPIDTKLEAGKQRGLEGALKSLEKLVIKVEEVLGQIHDVASKYDHAKSGGYEQALGQAGAAIRSAMEVLEHVDAGMAARNTFGQAMSAKVNAVALAHQPKPDWIGSVILLEESARLARQSQADAERDIQSAERVREQAAQAARDKARREAASSRESASISSGGGSSDDDDDSGGFGGFGGGSSGGGGASGSW